MNWEIFDGSDFEDAQKIAGEWIVRVRRQAISIRITVDRNGTYYYQNSYWAAIRQPKRPPAIKKGFASLEQALAQAVKDIRASLESGRRGSE